EPLGSRREPSVRLSAILEPQRFIAEQTRGAQPNCRLCKRKRYPLEPCERGAERLALGHVGASFIDALLGRADAHQANQRTTEIESLHHLDEARAFGADASRGGHPNAVKKELTAADCARSQIAKARARYARRVEVNVKCAHASSRLLRRAGSGQDQGGAGR